MKKSLVITSISSPSAVLMDYAHCCKKHNIDFIVMGDAKSPPDFSISGCDFWSIEQQKKMIFSLAEHLPLNHYSRKNLCYLLAMQRGSEVIIETDDDNSPLESFWCERLPIQKSRRFLDAGWINIYKYFSDIPIWPRGFPPEHIKDVMLPIEESNIGDHYCPIQQGLTNGDPDVDAMFRLTSAHSVEFSSSGEFALGRGCWSPFNSQNTTWFKDAFYLMYLPSFCSFRMCDIWRSFVAIRICWANNWNVLFHSPTVYQDRNYHNLLVDLEQEVCGYINNGRICKELENIDIQQGIEKIPDAIVKCYEIFIKNGLIEAKEMELIELWLLSVNKVINK